jgi:hypothetical protein
MHVLRADVLELQITVAYPFLYVVVVDIDVLSTLIVALSFDKLKRGLVITVELN